MRGVLIALAVLVALAALSVGGYFLYRRFVTDRVTDRGGMENPAAVDRLSDRPDAEQPHGAAKPKE